MNRTAKFILSFFLSVVFAIIAMVITYQIAIWISPAYILDEATGEKYGVMPIGQLMISILVAFVIFVLSILLFYFKYVKRKI